MKQRNNVIEVRKRIWSIRIKYIPYSIYTLKSK